MRHFIFPKEAPPSPDLLAGVWGAALACGPLGTGLTPHPRPENQSPARQQASSRRL